MAVTQLRKVEKVVYVGDKIVAVKHYSVDSQNRMQGLYEERDASGHVIKVGMCVDDRFEGLVEEFDGKGRHIITSYRNGKKEGLFSEHQGYLLVRRGVYHNDELVKEESFSYGDGGIHCISEWSSEYMRQAIQHQNASFHTR